MAGGERGQIIDNRFELLQRLGRGGMGTVWRALDTALHREVALKEVRPQDEAATGEATPYSARVLRERVMREARALARLNHPQVVTIYHIIDIAPHPWLVMELLPGPTLQSRLKNGPLPPTEVIRYGRDVLAALRAAHSAGVHHRDVKPANVLLREDGSAVLTDFGIAAVAGTTSVTATGNIVGSPEYLAPERIRGAQDHPSADLWSLGVLLYMLVEGHSPLRRQSTLATLSAVLEEPVPLPVRAGPLAPVLEAVLVKDPATRPDADQLDHMLADAARSGPALSPPVPTVLPPLAPVPVPYASTVEGLRAETPPTLARPPVQRNRRALAIGALSAVLLLGGGVTAGILLIGGDGDPADEDGETQARPAAPIQEENEPEPEPPVPDEALTEEEEPEPEQKPEPEPPETEENEPEPESPSQPEPEADPVPDDSSEQHWIAQLFSEPVSSGADTRDQRLAAVRANVPEAQVLLSDDFASLNPGYWVIYAPGPFASGQEAVQFCAGRGLTDSNACVGRYLSNDSGDKVLICHPQDGGSGRCKE